MAKNNLPEVLWYNYNMSEEKDFKAAVKAVQKICRASLEYDQWQTRTKAGSRACPICNEYYGYVKAETHHYPKTMFDVVQEVLEKHMFENTLDENSGFGICQEVMNRHLLGMVDSVVLCKACHEKFHADHPEVVRKVSETFEQQKNGKPIENQIPVDISQSSSIQTISEKDDTLLSFGTQDIPPEPQKVEPTELTFPPLPQIQHTESGMVFTRDGIEIEI